MFEFLCLQTLFLHIFHINCVHQFTFTVYQNLCFHSFSSKSYADSCFFIFEEYHNLIDVFERQKTDKLTSYWKKYNIKIDLKSEKISNFEFLYSILWNKLQILWQYLNKHLVKNFIQSSHSSFVFLILFAKKSDKELQFCIDYQVLNVITIWNQYSIFLI